MTTIVDEHLRHRDIPSARPSWVTDEVIAGLAGRVYRDPAGTGTTTAYAPYDSMAIATLPTSSAEDVARAVEAARLGAAAWQQRDFRVRAEVMLRFHDLFLAEQDKLIDLIQWEMGKARFTAWQEILQVANITRHYARVGRKYLAPRSARGAVPGLTKVAETRVPKGVVGIISPWNYPFYLGVGDAVPALLAGNGVVSKADSQTALTMLFARELMGRAGLPADLWQVVVGDGPVVGGALVEAVDYIGFTGSTATGRVVAEQAGRRLIGASLELGGKNPLIVRKDADIAKAAEGCVASSFANTGQMCIHTERVLVHQDVYDAFRTAVVDATRSLRLGQTYDYTVDIGSLASPAQLAKVADHVEMARALGATVLTGGRARPDLGPLMYEPTILEGVTAEMPVCAEETFGPVISLYPFSSDAEAIELANQGSYGLSASIWSKDSHTARLMAARIRSGSVNINDGAAAAAGSIEAPMGGMGDSGLGRRHGAEGIRKYTEAQTVAEQRGMPLGPPASMTLDRFVDFTNGQLKLLRKLRVR
ncbi:succinate-semialdehyde dehydrogenase (NADP(+)) [Nocardioides marmoriginsengisoli]|uniref:Succinate-semialdehyde dehydrogenase (NADP(+)) n=1 Tax=Nocardioides marmoriginsengisoli TaxID=661483 RepID=A0A3N0CPR0_9ACTN|nr:succinic semialdehyde dehydrogenase [Nocardioides marmoriginsengisoli]RNL65457.1 succinate-semialdehyde dehydrogenase (NADP(+)) [Nocardioides marmoriginsengisoli]